MGFAIGEFLRCGSRIRFRQVFFFQLTPKRVVAGICDIGEAVGHAKRKKNSVVRLIEARSARIATGIRRRRRASRISCPSLRSVRITGTGDCGVAGRFRITFIFTSGRYVI